MEPALTVTIPEVTGKSPEEIAQFALYLAAPYFGVDAWSTDLWVVPFDARPFLAAPDEQVFKWQADVTVVCEQELNMYALQHEMKAAHEQDTNSRHPRGVPAHRRRMPGRRRARDA